MGKNLVIVESPSKAKTIEKMLGDNYEVIASVGHVIDLPKNKINIDIENNFKPNYEVIKGKEEILKKLKDKSIKATNVFLASDPDREGEAIAWHISNYINQGAKVKRVEFNEITSKAIKNAIRNPRDINLDLVHSQQARRLLDRLVGFLISPLLWKIAGLKSSAGRVQSVALKLICELEDEILKFKPQTYYELEILIIKNLKLSLSKIDNEKIDKILEKEILDEALEILKDSKVKLTKLEEKNKTQSPPVVLKTSTLQQLASSYLGYNASKTMACAQKLYEGLDIGGQVKGLITYMRTDSIRVSEESMLQAKEYIQKNYGKEYVGKYVVAKSKNAQDAHEGIRPTDINLEPDLIKKYLTQDQYKLYKLIWERFLISQFSKVKYTQLSIEATKDKYTFKGSLNKVIFDGYYKILKTEDMIKTEDFPKLELNKEYKIDEILSKEAQTKAPSRFTEASLIKKLESLGIGRPSTYASIIESIKKREYVKIEDKKIVPTIHGKEVKKQLCKSFKNIMNVKFTASMEEKLDQIAQDKLNWQELLHEFYESLKVELEKFEASIKEQKELKIKTDMKCSLSDGYMYLKTGRFGKYLECENDSKDRVSLSGLEIDENLIINNEIKIKELVKEFLENKKGQKTDVFTEDNKRFLLKTGKFGLYLESEDYENDQIRKTLSKEIKSKLMKNTIKSENNILKLNDLIQKEEKEEKEVIKSVGKCEKCGNDFVVKTGRFGKFLACLGYPKCQNIKKITKKKK